MSGLMLLWSLLTKPGRQVVFLLLVLISTIAPYILLAKALYPRYLTFTLVPLALLLAQFWSWVSDQIAHVLSSAQLARLLSTVLLALLLILPVGIDLSLLTNPKSTPLPEILVWEFRSGWPAGYGAQELARYLEKEAAQNPGVLPVLHPIYWSQVNKGGLQVHLVEENQLEFIEFGWDLESELNDMAG